LTVDAYRIGKEDALAGMDKLPDMNFTLAEVAEYEQGYHDGWWEAD
jgi:hypothetical protein